MASRLSGDTLTGIRPLICSIPDSGIISIAYLNILGAELVPKLIRGFQQRYPKIRFELVQGNHTFISNRMENGECDLLISSAKLESDAYEWIPMRTVPLYVVVPLNWIP
ncbi:LysR substrate-binding domain-containing protein [Paenibacillus sp. 2KB_20]|uniref:LysR substrate-binding domain-containing protein n=1 Tax=Paenibacillus TaxID=44249 RepID=UPI003D2E7FB4